MLSAIEDSFTELRHWMPWAQDLPTEAALAAVLQQGENDFRCDSGWDYALFERDTDVVVGGCRRSQD